MKHTAKRTKRRKPVHEVRNIIWGSTLCGLADKYGKFYINLGHADEKTTCRKCKAVMKAAQRDEPK